MGRAFFTSYLAGEPAAHTFFPPVFREADRRIERARNAAKRCVSPALARALAEQQAQWGMSPQRQSNLEALASGDTSVVVTGQQVGLFLGPLYAFYKAASAIAMARAIEKESGVRCVPLFWLQSEDHDFEEIREAKVAGPDGAPTVLSLPDELDGQGRASVAYRILPPAVTSLVDELAQHLPVGPAADEALSVLRQHYRPGVSVVAAFARAMAAVFAEDGLLLLDPRDGHVADLASPIYRRCLDECEAVEQILHDRSLALKKAGFAEQVAVRDGGALVFFHRGATTGPRLRMLRAAGGWHLAGTEEVVAASEIDRLLACDPLRFSTSALLRPLVQDSLLPTVGYVGGPGEINYFAQVQPLYAHFRLEPPLLLPRARFRLIDARTRRRLAQLGISADDAGKPAEVLLPRLSSLSSPSSSPSSSSSSDPDGLREIAERQILSAVDAMTSVIGAQADRGLRKLAQRTRDRVAYRLDRLLARYTRVLAERNTTAVRRLQQVQWTLFPDGVPQERFYGWPWLVAQLGVDGARRRVLAHLAAHGPFVTELQDLEP